MALVNSSRPMAQRRSNVHLRSVVALVAAGLLLRGVLRYRNAEGDQVSNLQPSFVYYKTANLLQTVNESFPGALPGQEVMDKALAEMDKYGIVKENSIYGQSCCPDEINGDAGHLPKLMSTYYGHSFPLGGLGGAPFAGKTGFGAFSHHVPDNGNVVIVFGPHIGFSIDGEAGKFLRTGQASLSTACGALVAAYNQCMSGQGWGSEPRDVQQAWLRNKLRHFCPHAATSKHPMVEVVQKAYEVIEQEMLSIVNTGFGPGKLVLLGGIQINMPYPLPGYWLPKHFSIRSKDMAPVDLMPAAFGR